ncbi:MAG: Disulfide-bond oxidoreductase YfcG [Alphaproteobacteria bacterium MarineAlpha2_Bin1]|nr:MAG: Disulfide-bond oxidoreductase YfcG [Alphaproteobacteria bacterium MarineAlpha2_Bin1]
MIDFYCVPTSNGQKIAILLNELGLEFNLIKVKRLAGEPPSDEYLKINPVGKYPSIIDFDCENKKIIIFETQAIAQYLTEKTQLLLPNKIEERVNSHIWANVISAGLTPLLGSQYFIEFRAKTNLGEINYWILSEIKRYLKAIDERLEKNIYLAGDTISYCDVMAFPIMFGSIKRLPDSLNNYNHISRWIDVLKNRDSFRRGLEITNF